MPVLDYNIHYDIAAFVLYVLLAYFFYSRKDLSAFQNRFFSGIFFTSIIATILDASVCFMLNDKFWFPDDFTTFVISLYFLLRNLMPYFLFLYALAATGRMTVHGKPFFILISLPLSLDFIALLQNAITKNIYFMQEGNYYKSKYYMALLIASMTVYGALTIYLVTRYRNSFSDTQSSSNIFVILSCIALCFVKYYFIYVKLEMFFRAIALHIFLFSMENETDAINPNSNVYNRKTFERQTIRMLNSKRPYTVIIVKLSNIRELISIFGIDFINRLLTRDITNYFETVVFDRKNIYDCNHYTFAIIIDEKHSSRAKDIAETFHEKLTRDWIYDNLSIPLSVTIGIINIPLDLNTLDSMMQFIDTTEENHHYKIAVLKDSRLNLFKRETKILSLIKQSIEKKTIKLVFTPVWDCDRKTFHGAEAFVQIEDSELGIISDEEITSVAEKYGIIRELGIFVMHEACKFTTSPKAKKEGFSGLVINLSISQCLQRDLPFIFKEIVDSYGLHTERIYFDIKETFTIMNTPSALHTIRNLWDLGFFLALDDYGIGNTDITSLFTIGFRTVKFAPSILKKAKNSEPARIFLNHTIAMLKEMNIDIAMNGVDTKELKAFSEKAGVNFCEGAYFGKLLPEDKFIEFLHNANFSSNT